MTEIKRDLNCLLGELAAIFGSKKATIQELPTAVILNQFGGVNYPASMRSSIFVDGIEEAVMSSYAHADDVSEQKSIVYDYIQRDRQVRKAAQFDEEPLNIAESIIEAQKKLLDAQVFLVGCHIGQTVEIRDYPKEEGKVRILRSGLYVVGDTRCIIGSIWKTTDVHQWVCALSHYMHCPKEIVALQQHYAKLGENSK